MEATAAYGKAVYLLGRTHTRCVTPLVPSFTHRLCSRLTAHGLSDFVRAPLPCQATHPWFAACKALYSSFAERVDPDLQLFGENMSAVHSIEYDELGSHFYLFSVRRASSGEWFAWDNVVALARTLEVPHAPVWWRGRLTGLEQLEAMLRRAASEPSAVATHPGEGFVVRMTAAYTDEMFTRAVAKYVRANHMQTEPDFRKKWQKATVVEGRGMGWRSPLEHEQPAGATAGRPAAGRPAAGGPAASAAAGAAVGHGKGKGRGQARGTGRGRGRQPAVGDGEASTAGGAAASWHQERVAAARGPAGLLLPALPPALTPREELKAVYRGPTKRSNWVVPGRVLAGDRSGVDKASSLEGLVRMGVDTFVCLQV